MNRRDAIENIVLLSTGLALGWVKFHTSLPYGIKHIGSIHQSGDFYLVSNWWMTGERSYKIEELKAIAKEHGTYYVVPSPYWKDE